MNENQNKQGICARLTNAAASFTGTAAAMYRSYWERENEKLRAEQAQIRAQQAREAQNAYLNEVYPATANLLMTAINDTTPITYILPVPSIEKLEAATKLEMLPNGTIRLLYRWWIRAGVPASTQQTITKILQRQLNALTADDRFYPLCVAVRLRPCNEVFFGITFKNSTQQGSKK